eukprot:GFUD01061259.1.p1 GENE.GFUD01061259.1~~GFUD01061259.1.p1  ORF type:complete len:479 (-),score=68.28 GFUD01061259.1:88-1494(-)
MDSEDEIQNLPPPPTTLLTPKTPRQKRRAPHPPICPPPPESLSPPDSPEIFTRSRTIDLDYTTSNKSTLRTSNLRNDCQAQTISEYFLSRIGFCWEGCHGYKRHRSCTHGDSCHKISAAKIASVLLVSVVTLVIGFAVYFFVINKDLKTSNVNLGLLLVGGNDGVENSSLDLVTKTGSCKLHTFPSLPSGRRGGVAGLLQAGSSILFCGGLDAINQERSNCWQLHSHENSWKAAPALPQATAYAAHITVEDKLYVIGGWYKSQAVNTLQIFSNGGWSTATPMLTARYGACAVAYKKYVVVVGGWKSLQANQAVDAQKTIEVYSIVRKKWKSLQSPDKFEGLSTSSCARISDSGKGGMILVGGITYTKSFKPQTNTGLDILTFGGENGEIGVKQSAGVPVSWQAGLGWVGDWLLLAGGRGASGISEQRVFRWKEGQQWEQFGDLTVPRDQAASLVVPKQWAKFASNCTW